MSDDSLLRSAFGMRNIVLGVLLTSVFAVAALVSFVWAPTMIMDRISRPK